ncbi:MAG: hypothetical protein EBX95_15480, partial [Acidimicrobiia bacterium]|nr:hypothetical protein [Acidimicrobiia bacterium]
MCGITKRSIQPSESAGQHLPKQATPNVLIAQSAAFVPPPIFNHLVPRCNEPLQDLIHVFKTESLQFFREIARFCVEQAIKTGLGIEGKVNEVSVFDRKNYFYPDNPKNYQLTQKDFPVVVGGQVEIELPGASRNVMGEHKFIRIHHAHLEEDVGKLSHAGSGSLVDYNRAGVPLLEIVTEPDLRSAAEAEAFLRSLVAMLTQAGVADCDMEKGQLRCDCNVSVRRRGDAKLGTRTETKNLNSISSVRDTVIYETARQIRELEAGRSITQETRG